MKTTAVLLALALAAEPIALAAQEPTPDVAAAMHWRNIGPARAGRARALAGVPAAPGRPAALYAGFDNGGVWRTTDYGANWVPLFDAAPTGAIGAIAVAPSNPAVIYVGSGAGIIRPDLAVGNGMYKSTDTGRTWTNIGLGATQMIAYVDVDPTNPDRLFVAALGHPYGPNADRGIFRSTDGGRSWAKVLYKDEYTSGNDVRIDPSNPQVVYAALWQQQEAFWEGGSFGGGSGGVFKSTDGGTTWTQLTDGLPQVLEANLAIAPSNPQIVYAMIASVNPRGGSGPVGLYRSDDGGAHWTLKTRTNAMQDSTSHATIDPRPMTRIGGGDLPTMAVDPTNPDVVYSASIVFWRTEDAGTTWTAVRGAPGGDDYQRPWVSPNDPALLLVVSDQGAVVSANRGASWSNWYNQSTAAVYHTTTDNAYPYRVCSGQQDSGSLCVKSRSDDGEITFHDWHPVNIQEYGMAAPDPRDPDVVFGSARTGVSRYDRRTGQTSSVGPGADQRTPPDSLGRNVRTMPLIFSPVNPDALFYASNVVWKSLDRGRSWTRISDDLTRGASWAIPASAGKYAQGFQVTARGAITALAPSPRSALVLWSGSDDGSIHVTTNGGRTWSDVTPDEIQPWTRIYNMDAGHFDAQTAYAAANTLRIDDMRPHVFKTHDGGRTWTEIDAGIDSGSVVNTVREDPRVPGLLYAGTDTQVWVSFDDGGHWQSLRLDMPAISVRDLEVKDDSLCGCADLIAGTHGRGFWILDDLTPLRQRAEILRAQGGNAAYLVKPLVATRVRFGTNEPTPWPPELPAGENPPAGAIIDYYLPQAASGRVTMEIVDAAGKTIRTYASDDAWPGPDSTVPLYWSAPHRPLSAAAGMHRFTWDMRYQALTPPGAGLDATGVVPHRGQPSPQAPWAAPGRYTVRLTVNGTAYTQPLTLRLDPRVKTPAVGLTQLATLTRQYFEQAQAVQQAYEEARRLSDQATDAALKARIDSVAPPQNRPRGRGVGGFGRPNAQQAPTLSGARDALLGAVMSMQNAELTPTAAQVAACRKAAELATRAIARWNAVKRGS